MCAGFTVVNTKKILIEFGLYPDKVHEAAFVRNEEMFKRYWKMASEIERLRSYINDHIPSDE
jgi:hypothetical protein